MLARFDNIHGFDTETIDGYCRLMATEDNAYKIYGFQDIIDILFYSDYKSSVFVCYNLDYDISAILKYLPLEKIVNIYHGIEVNYGKVRIRYYKNKELKLSCNKITHYFYDVYPYFHMSLDKASEKYLHDKKLDVDRTNITEKNIYTDKVIEYCKHDAYLTKQLFLYWFNTLPDNLKNVKPISTAYYSAKYFKNEIQTNKVSSKLNILFKKAFYGGRFEVYKRGHFKNVYYYDINSAYPYMISKLTSLENAKIVESKEYDKDCNYGIYNVNIDIANKYYSIIPYRLRNGLIIYPVGVLNNIWITKSELEDIINERYEYKINYALQLYTQQEYPFQNKIKKMYIKKQTGVYAYKILLNSLYGKFCQGIEKYREAKNYKYMIDELAYIDDKLYQKYIDYKSSNFVYASEITARARQYLYQYIRKHYSKIIAVFTDCLISTERLEDIPIGAGLGYWKSEQYDDIWIIGSGVYFMRKGNDMLGHYRGFKLNNANEIFEKILHSKSHVVDIEVIERSSLIQASMYEDFFNEFGNIIYALTKKLNLNFDNKRIWYQDFKKGSDVDTMQIESLAIPVFKKT